MAQSIKEQLQAKAEKLAYSKFKTNQNHNFAAYKAGFLACAEMLIELHGGLDTLPYCELNGCSTGDCPHEKQTECFNSTVKDLCSISDMAKEKLTKFKAWLDGM